jgi:hypothetical protein
MPSHGSKPKCSKTNKTVFLSLSEVEMFLSAPERRILRHYHCDHCTYYHVTSQPIKDANKYFGAKPLKYSNEFKKYMDGDS